MESVRPNPPTDDELREVERAAAAPYLDYPRLPWWWTLVAGAWFTGVLAPSTLDVPSNPGLQVALVLVLTALLGAGLSWYAAKRGVMPSNDPRHAPPEIARLMWLYYAGAVVALVGVFVLRAVVAPGVAVVAIFVISSGGLGLYEWRYEVAADRARARLAP